jgi:hypothetical protein
MSPTKIHNAATDPLIRPFATVCPTGPVGSDEFTAFSIVLAAVLVTMAVAEPIRLPINACFKVSDT